MKRVLFIYRNPSTFVNKDREILETTFAVEAVRAKGLSSYARLIASVPRSDLVFVWFGNWWAALATLAARRFNKPCIIVAGGYDAAHVPEINYGLMGHWLLGPIARYAFRNATLILSVSKYTHDELLKNAGVNSQVIYNGIDANNFRASASKEALALTIGKINSTTVKKKGFEYFVQAATYLDNVPCRVIGSGDKNTMSYLKKMAPDNVEFVEFMPHQQIVTEFQRATVYVQASWHESFGVAVTEAMACECTPVVTQRSALPEVVGNAGYYVPVADPRALADGIRQALQNPRGSEARSRVLERFTIERRAKELIESINQAGF
jgi:glycosyltransferase involved in cell wall biosynthesis